MLSDSVLHPLTEHILCEANGNTELLCDRGVRGHTRPALTFTCSSPLAPQARDPDSNSQSLAPMWDLFTHRGREVFISPSMLTLRWRTLIHAHRITHRDTYLHPHYNVNVIFYFFFFYKKGEVCVKLNKKLIFQYSL